MAHVAYRFESLKKWTIGTFKNSRQQLLEHMGKTDKTVDEVFEKECEDLKELHRRYGCLASAARDFTKILTQLSQAEKNLAESLQHLSVKEVAIKSQCTTTSESMLRIANHAAALDNCLRYFQSAVETLYSKTIVDTLETIYATEAARIEFDVCRHDQATASPTAIHVANEKASVQRDKYERLKDDVRVKLRLLEENRISVMAKQLERLQTALAAYFSGNAELLAVAIEELRSLNVPNSSLIL
uniref:AH domain-containing protein n=1 Tax=Angiostrongylus cantonensis TaxID=6313 RepID=A0A0K0CWJ0_ANGCA